MDWLVNLLMSYPRLSEEHLLAWVTGLGTVCCSAPTVTLLLALFFKHSIQTLLYRGAGLSPEQSIMAATGRGKQIVEPRTATENPKTT